MSAAHACSLPSRHAWIKRLSLHVASGPRRSRGRRLLRFLASLGGTGWPPAPEQLLDVPQRVMVENRRPQVAKALRRADEDIGADKADNRQMLRHQFLHAVVQTLAQLHIARG